MNFDNRIAPFLFNRLKGRATQTINAFMAGWKKSLDEINKEILNLFPNFKNGTNILQATLTQLVEYYHRFQKILTQHPFRTCHIIEIVEYCLVV